LHSVQSSKGTTEMNYPMILITMIIASLVFVGLADENPQMNATTLFLNFWHIYAFCFWIVVAVAYFTRNKDDE